LELWQLSARDIREGVTAKRFSAREAAESCLARTREVEPQVHAFLEITEGLALAAADESDRRMAAGECPRALEGVPIAIKDNMCLVGAKCTCASKILGSWRPPYNGTVVERLLAAGASPIGKTNLDEFAMGSSTENSAFGTTRNPWDTSRAPGGSSGGSAAAVAMGAAPLAVGSDTGGSIRQPAAFCGVVGMKPTYGCVSRYGLVAFASSLDQIGPFARDITDAGLLLDAISGHDPRDSTSSTKECAKVSGAVEGADVKGLRIGMPKEYFALGVEPGVEAAVRKAASALESAGAHIEEISLPHTEYAVATYYVIATAEASSNLARYDGVHYGHRAEGTRNIIDLYSRTRAEGFGAEVKRRVMLGTFALSSGYYDAYYLRALKVRARSRADFDRAFEKVDVILGPTAPTVAFGLGEKTADPISMYLSDIFTISANLAGIPALSMPCGKGEDGLPVGLHLVAPAFEEERLFSVARAYELASGEPNARPPIWNA
jgi:aspartyl-tRNA(Asn)/glutamyl-tRNA(Gln) amidotransferase subunit A